MKLSELTAVAKANGCDDPHLMVEDRHGIPQLVTGADVAWTNVGDVLVLGRGQGDDGDQ